MSKRVSKNTVEAAEKAEIVVTVANDMMDKMRDLLNGGKEEAPSIEEEVEVNSGPPLEEAVTRAIYALNEIAIYGEYGNASMCATEAREALVFVKALKEKYEEQQKMMDVLTSPVELKTKELV